MATALFSPLIASNAVVMGAVPRERPAIVKGPEDLIGSLFQIVDQYPQMNGISMQIMQVDNVRSDPLFI